ncbi:hypothetical protein D3C84_982870 [compost metagenome]
MISASSVKKKPNMPPTWVMASGMPCLAAAAFSPSATRAVLALSCSYRPGSCNRSSMARPAAMATGLPDRVPAWYTGPVGAMYCITFFLPPKAPTGMPAPMILPRVVRSGSML